MPLAAAGCLLAIFAAGFVAAIPLRVAAYLTLLGSALYLSGLFRKEDIQWMRGLIQRKDLTRG